MILLVVVMVVFAITTVAGDDDDWDDDDDEVPPPPDDDDDWDDGDDEVPPPPDDDDDWDDDDDDGGNGSESGETSNNETEQPPTPQSTPATPEPTPSPTPDPTPSDAPVTQATTDEPTAPPPPTPPATPHPMLPENTGAMRVASGMVQRASVLADPDSPSADRLVVVTLQPPLEFRVEYCFDAVLTFTPRSEESRDHGIPQYLGSIIQGDSITCTPSELRILLMPYPSLFLPFDDSVGLSFIGDFYVGGDLPSSSRFELLFLADQPGVTPRPPPETSTEGPTATAPEPPPDGEGPSTADVPTDPPQDVDEPPTSLPKNGSAPDLTSDIAPTLYTLATGFGFLGSLVAGTVYSGTAITLLTRSSVLHHASCTRENLTHVPFNWNPLQIDIDLGVSPGTEPYSKYIAAIVTNLAFSVVMTAIHALIGFVASRVSDDDDKGRQKRENGGEQVKGPTGIRRGFANVAFPSGFAFASWSITMGPTLSASLTIFLNMGTIDTLVVGIAAVATLLHLAVLVAGFLAVTHYFSARWHPFGRNSLHWVVASSHIWGDRSLRKRGFTGMFGKLFTAFVPMRPYFGMIDQLLSLLPMIAQGVRRPFPACKEWLFAPLVVFTFLHALLLFWFDPHDTFVHRVASYGFLVVIFGGNVVGAGAFSSDAEWATRMDQLGALIAVACALYGAVTAGLVLLRRHFGILTEAPLYSDEDSSDDQDTVARKRRIRKGEDEDGDGGDGGGPIGGNEAADTKALEVPELPGQPPPPPSDAPLAFGPPAQNPPAGAAVPDVNHTEPDPVIAAILAQGVWKRVADPAGHAGSAYYFNVQSGQTTWDLASELGIAGALAGARGGALGGARGQAVGVYSALQRFADSESDDAGDVRRWQQRRRGRGGDDKWSNPGAERKKSKKRFQRYTEKREQKRQRRWEELRIEHERLYKEQEEKDTAAGAAGAEKLRFLTLAFKNPVEEALKSGEWQKVKDAQSGKTYFFNPTSKKTTWNLFQELGVDKDAVKAARKQAKDAGVDMANPDAAIAAAAAAAAGAAAGGVSSATEGEEAIKAALATGGWKELADPASGKKYYHHAASQKTTWDLRAELGIADPPPKLEKEFSVQVSDVQVSDVTVSDCSTDTETRHRRAHWASDGDESSADSLGRSRKGVRRSGADLQMLTELLMLRPSRHGDAPNASMYSQLEGFPQYPLQVDAAGRSGAMDSSYLHASPSPSPPNPLRYSPPMAAGAATGAPGYVYPDGTWRMGAPPAPVVPFHHHSHQHHQGVGHSSNYSPPSYADGADTPLLAPPTAADPGRSLVHGFLRQQEGARGERADALAEAVEGTLLRALSSGEWVEIADGTTGQVYFRQTATGRVALDLRAEFRGALLATGMFSELAAPPPRPQKLHPPAAAPPKSEGEQRALTHIDATFEQLLRSGAWVMFVDPVTRRTTYRQRGTGRVSFDLRAEIGNGTHEHLREGYFLAPGGSRRRREKFTHDQYDKKTSRRKLANTATQGGESQSPPARRSGKKRGQGVILHRTGTAAVDDRAVEVEYERALKRRLDTYEKELYDVL